MEAWARFLSEIEQELGPAIVSQWLRPIKVARFDAGNLYLEAADSFQADWFEEHIRPRMKEKLFNNNQRPIKVHLSVISSKKPSNKEGEAPPRFRIYPDSIDPELSLENYLPSPQNLMAFKLISESVQNTSFNPIYLYGPKGAGKTHLLCGAATAMEKQGKRVFYVKAESFTEHVVQAIRLGFMQEFRRVYRDIDVLIIDDIHIFSRKNATQEEFFHTFNTLHTLGYPILLSANVPPSQLSEIEPRLISRFEWGITLSLEKSDPKPILQKKAALWKLSISPELEQFLLEKFPLDPILALQALAFRSQGKGLITCDLAQRLLGDLLQQEEKNALTPEKIIKAIAAHYGIRSEDLLGKSQMRECALPRQIAMYLCRERLKMPFQKIGELFSRDHSTVMTSVKQVQKGIEEKKIELLSI